MRYLKKFSLLAIAAVAVMGFSASSASAGLDYTGPLHATQTTGTLSSGSLSLTCDLTAEGEILDAGWPAHGYLHELNFDDCRVSSLPFIICDVSVQPEEIEIHATPETDETLHVELEDTLTVTRVCPIVGTCEYTATGTEGIYDEHTNTLVFQNQPFTGLSGCANATWNANFAVDEPAELHWDKD